MNITPNTIKWASVVILGGLGVYFIVINSTIFWKTWIKKEACPSVMPFLGGLFADAAILIAVGKDYWFLCLIPLVLDWGCIPAVIRFIYVLYREMKIKK